MNDFLLIAEFWTTFYARWDSVLWFCMLFIKKKKLALKTKSLIIISIISRVLKSAVNYEQTKRWMEVNEDLKPAFMCFKKILSQHNSLLWISTCLLWNLFDIWFFLICLIWCQWILLIRVIFYFLHESFFYESTFCFLDNLFMWLLLLNWSRHRNKEVNDYYLSVYDDCRESN